jgi:hypothetical protein
LFLGLKKIKKFNTEGTEAEHRVHREEETGMGDLKVGATWDFG